MKCKWSLTFEFNEAQPETVKGTIEANAVQTVAHRAVMEAKKQKPGVNWSSMVLLLEKIGNEPEIEDTESK